VQQLLDIVTEKGLRTKETAKYPGHSLGLNTLYTILKNPYYIGVVTYRGVQYEGNHEPLVTPDVWLRVQDVLAAHDKAGEKVRRHPHYLKGSIFCAKCGSRLCFSRSRGNGGSYDYFFCLGKSRYRFDCDMKYVAVDDVEAAVEALYEQLQLRPERVAAIKKTVGAEMAVETKAAEQDARRYRATIARVETDREKLLHAHYAGAVPVDLLKAEMDRFTRERAEAETQLALCETRYQEVRRVLDRALKLAGSCSAQYREAPSAIRRQLNQGFFKAIYIGDEGRVDRVELTDVFAALLAHDARNEAGNGRRQYRRAARSIGAPDEARKLNNPELLPWVGSNAFSLVDLGAALSNPS
jgi:site-specific DNA recombinase